jgi:hypothetical protein
MKVSASLLVLALISWALAQETCFEIGFHGGWIPAPCNHAEDVAARTRVLIDTFEREEAAKAGAFYDAVILPQIEAHLVALPRMLTTGALEPGIASMILVDWPKNGTRTMRKKVCALLKDQGFECSEATNTARDLFVFWTL